MAQTKIEWCDKVWNPITGCSPVSEGCQNCYARRMANRLKGRCGYPKNDPFGVTFHPKRLEEPLLWKKPSRIFVCSMGDIFHQSIHPEKIEVIFETMDLCARMGLNHLFLLLTKRPLIMKQRIEESAVWKNNSANWTSFVWLGVSIENQRTADERIPVLLQIPAAKRFVSVEPMLGSVDLGSWVSFRGGIHFRNSQPGDQWKKVIPGIDWVICGGLSLPGGKVPTTQEEMG